MRNLSRLLILAALFFLTFTSSVWAANPLDVVINEIAWMGTKIEGIESKNWWRYEWLELYNNTSQPTSLDGWKIELYRNELDWALELKGVIPSQGYFLIVASDKISPNYDLNYSNLGGKFINIGQKVLLKDSLGNIIDNLDCFSYGKWFAGDNSTKQTMERKNSQASDNQSANWATSQNPGGTPKAKNSVAIEILSPEEQIITPKPEPELLPPEEKPQPEPKLEEPKPITYPSGIRINEILPSPTGPDEETAKIDINTAPLKDLIKIVHIGEVRAQELISLRPFYSLDDLARIKGIGEKALEDIKKQGLAWIDPALEPPKIEKTEPREMGLAAVAEPLKQEYLGGETPKSLSVFLIALAVAIFSGIIILILKKKSKTEQSL